ncbi:hypothetical protein N7468_009398 [Penicillium chermesinum]|uniref:Serine hydrolase domain-containing protein n=1 Tax=Penicillium chermesinum TaxID=63820 RepID=A0A9W9NK71_9EURO|nr:uncharacterized protein N7468_009398 [Penicillium chermesinum]KAJ5220194.1 hypothetical protein N7468_009398 [Penicillium chermesinum]KAJ6157638.1 hypothetical protein N7470_005230 [Penicillium chermesinum]
MKILCLHGHTQTGPILSRKTLRLQEHIRRAFPGTSFYFPTGPIAYKVSDRLDYSQLTEKEKPDNFKDPDAIETHSWFRLHEDDPPRGFFESMDRIADILQTEGPFDGMICFSQGSIIGGMCASLLEGPKRRRRFEEYSAVYPDAIRYPEAYKNLDHPPLKFVITYGAYMGCSPIFSAFYTDPIITTPFMHFMGEFDPVVPSEMVAAVDLAQIGGPQRRKMMHPGAHAIPCGNEYHEAAVDFIKSALDNSYFGPLNDLPMGRVPPLEYHDTPEQTPLTTPKLSSIDVAASLPISEGGGLVPEKLDRYRKSRSPRKVTSSRRSRASVSSGASLSGRRSISSATSSTGSRFSRTRATSETESPVFTTDQDNKTATATMENKLIAAGYDVGGMRELLLSEFLDEMVRRHGRSGKLYFVPDEEEMDALA